MNHAMIIGNLTADPEMRVTKDQKGVCGFTVAVNRRNRSNSNQPDADFFRISAFESLGKLCNQYLKKGKKVSVIGPVSVRVYTSSNGESRASLEMLANSVEFLSPKEPESPVNDPDDPWRAQQ
ncbi:MAG: single-stranded DNA-binding protein [Oscillospiraceae bacterium]|nr:single-stranded DNA-binding protein [Oscillospiraceae bacterium]